MPEVALEFSPEISGELLRLGERKAFPTSLLSQTSFGRAAPEVHKKGFSGA